MQHFRFPHPIILVYLVALLTSFTSMVTPQTLFLSPDTVKVSSGASEQFDVELWADKDVLGMNLYTVVLDFDNELLGFYLEADTTYWDCLAYMLDSTCLDSLCLHWTLDSLPIDSSCTDWQEDSTCIDSVYVDWLVDSTCLDWRYIEWQVDSACLDSVFVEWLVDTTCLNYQYFEWLVDTTPTDSACLDWQVDSTCLGWECIVWNGDICEDSTCLEWQVDSTCLGWEFTAWDYDSTYIDSTICIEYQFDSTAFNEWICSDWDLDSTWVDSWVCFDWDIDSTFIGGYLCTEYDPEHTFTCLAWEYTEWDVDSICDGGWECTDWQVDSTCLDSTQTTQEYADFFTVDTTLPPIEEGPLMNPPSAETVPFYVRLNGDSTELTIESLIFWPRMAVDGPGLLATIHLFNKGSGVYYFDFDSTDVMDVNGDPMAVEGIGDVLLLNAPPTEFDLNTPLNGAEIELGPGEFVTLSWQEAQTFYVGDSVLYELILSDVPTFDGVHTISFMDINATSHSLYDSEVWDGSIYWKVRAYNTIGGEQYSTQTDWSFLLDLATEPPAEFELVSPVADGFVNMFGNRWIVFEWMPSSSENDGDILLYDLYAYFSEASEDSIHIEDIDGTAVDADSALFSPKNDYTWHVVCTNMYGQPTQSPTRQFLTYIRGDANGDGGVNIADASYIINAIFFGGDAPYPEIAGDANCDTNFNIADASYIINWIFFGGNPPCSY